jgi:hypothetical protein
MTDINGRVAKPGDVICMALSYSGSTVQLRKGRIIEILTDQKFLRAEVEWLASSHYGLPQKPTKIQLRDYVIL